ncbi:HET-domain-containing protein, partial [Acephala macrosclerotiorum]
LKRFLRSCETRHGTSCANVTGQVGDQKSDGDRRSVTLLLIDVEKHCLVSFDSSLEYRYIALSYVWGGANSLTTTRANLFSLMQHNSLEKAGDQLATVVRDAMIVVSVMGERYLWVDSLCIVQDDLDWKHLQISQMDLIYSQSILTIVASSSTNANDGLPGINKTPRFPTAIRVQDVVIRRPTSYDDSSLRKTVYETRGWTLQEKVLSRRCLFFSQEQVLFRC